MSGVPTDLDGGASVFPVSFAQERLWFIDQLEPDNPTYNVPAALRISTPIHAAALCQALQGLVDRHEAFRTTFAVIDGRPHQVIAARREIRLERTDLTHLPEHEREAEAEQITQREAATPFDLARDLLLRARLVQIGSDEFLFLLTTHHIVTDLWSLVVLFRDFSALYDAAVRNVPSDLPSLPVQYADFALWQHRDLTGPKLDRLLQFWTDALGSAAAETTFPRDHPRPPAQSYRGATLPITITPGTADRLSALSREEGATLFITLLAAFQALLGRYAGSDDVVVGTPIANRMRSETSNVIGFFANTLALRADSSGDPRFRELLGRVRDATLAAYDHQDLPFEKLVAALQPERNPSMPPLFQVLFSLQTTAERAAECEKPDEQAGVWQETLNGTSKFDVAVLLRETSRGIEGGFQYCPDLYDEGTVEQIADHFGEVLMRIAGAPDARISELLQLPDATRRRVVEDWGRGGGVPAPFTSVVDEFSQRVREMPGAPAVRFHDACVSYAELDALADRAASSLRAHGVAPGHRVGLCMAHSARSVAAIVGILRVGAAYVPLDPGYPIERLSFIAQDADLHLILSGEGVEALPIHHNVVQLNGRASTETVGLATIPPAPEDTAYVIYTSGSTGQPKGVSMPHRALSNLVAWQIANSGVGVGSRTLHITPLSFDVSVQELFATLCTGGELVLAGAIDRFDTARLLDCLSQQRVQRVFLPPVLLQLLADAACDDRTPTYLEEIIVAGEQLTVTNSIRSFVERSPGCVLRNQYGPTETHVVTDERVSLDETSPALGRPIWNTQIYLLDPDGQLVPPGSVGEICVGGAPLATGYYGRTDLTAERFVTVTVGSEQRRMYRTGDLARFDGSGRLWFCGRMDGQLKIRGFRVEPGEVEAYLVRLPAVRGAVVVGVEHAPGQRRLEAFVEADPNSTDPQQLRDALRERLPQYAVPSSIRITSAFPMTPSGKIDRRRLVSEMGGESAWPTERVGSRTSLESEIAAIWAGVLGIGQPGIHDVFFDIGGHSLAAAQVIARIRRDLKAPIPLRAMFDAPTIAELSVEVVACQAAAVAPETLRELLAEVSIEE